jgi:anthranilate/para-aminobenzoate synthase component II
LSLTTTNETSELKEEHTVLLSALDNYGGHPFDHVFDVVFPCYGADEVQAAYDLVKRSAVIIWGGADISPTIYNQPPNKYCGAGEKLSRRDQMEVEIAYKAMELGLPIIGICRGAQLMCALSGGSLVQHVERHAGGWHKIVTSDEEELMCPSLHHQMMYPWSRKDDGVGEFEMLAWCPEPRSNVYYVEPSEKENEEPVQVTIPGKQEPEVIWIPKTKSLCIQSHPEFIQDVQHPFVQYCLNLTKRLILEQQ